MSDLYSIYDLDGDDYLRYSSKHDSFSWGEHCPNAVFTKDFIYTTYKTTSGNDTFDDFLVVPVNDDGVNFIDAVNLNEFMDMMVILLALESNIEEVTQGFINSMSVPAYRVPEDEEFKNGFLG